MGTLGTHRNSLRELAILRDLGDGLILRQATAADTEALAAFNADVLRDPGDVEPNEPVAAWTRDTMSGEHPTVQVGDFTVVEDTRNSAIVSSLCLISQTWSYGGIPFGVGRPEAVATHPAYRRRGLVRAQFEVAHAWSAARGHKMQAVTGIPWFYRQFGYEMALTLGGGWRGHTSYIPKLRDGETEPYRVRPAVEADLAFIAQVYDEAMRRFLVACVRDKRLWQYELNGRSEKNDDRVELRVVEAMDGEQVGFLAHLPKLWGPHLATTFYELKPGISWLAVTPSVLRYLQATGEQYAAQHHRTFEGVWFLLGTEHPVYQVARDRLPEVCQPYTWYVRVPDVVGFLRRVAPLLERRLAESVLAGHTGVLKLNFYRDGLRMIFEHGRLKMVEAWEPAPAREPWVPAFAGEGTAAQFPGLTFLQLLFGYRTLEELDHAFPDCWAETDEARTLLQVLFPKQPSLIWPVV